MTTEKKPNTDHGQEDDVETLFVRYARTRDSALRERLVVAHRGLVRYLAGKFANRGEPLEDLIQVGTIGLINAIDRFDAERGTKFTSFATPTIVGELRRYFRDKAWSLKVPRRLQDLNIAASKAQQEMVGVLGRPPTVHEVAERIGATDEETLEAIELANAYGTVSLDSIAHSGGDSTALPLSDLLGVEDSRLTAMNTFGDLEHAVEMLEPRERAIIVYRFFHDLSQSEIAKKLNISQMHVSRLQNRALQQLKDLMTSET